MRKGILITRGTIIEHGAADPRWSIAVSTDTTILEIAALMVEFGCYAELGEGDTDLRLLPLDFRPPPTAEALADFYAQRAKPPRARLQAVGR
jgi:hypothetical protein